MTTLLEIEARAKLYADARESLSQIVSNLNAGIEALKRKAMPDIKRAIGRASTHHDQLRTMIEGAPTCSSSRRAARWPASSSAIKRVRARLSGRILTRWCA